MQLHPLADRVVAKPVEVETKTSAGILLANQAKDDNQLAEVLAVGKDVTELKVGDKIVHGFVSDRFKQDNDELIIIKEKDVLAVLKG